MKSNSENTGDLLVKLCELARSNNIEIRVRQHPFNPTVFEIQLDRGDHHACSMIDTAKNFGPKDPERSAEYAFRRSLYDIEQLDKGEEK